MLIRLSSSQSAAIVAGAEDLRSLAVEIANGMSSTDAADKLGALGHIDGDHVWLHISTLRAAAQPAGKDDWSADFDSMITHAASNGWVDAAGVHLRAHIYRPDQ
jgi:hypothetical protein